MSTAKKLYLILGGFHLIALFLNDLLSIYFPFLKPLSTVLWLNTYFFVILFALYWFYILARKFISSEISLSFVMLLFFIALIGVSIFQPRYLSGESTQEINCAISHLHPTASSSNSEPICLFGYPDRQFYLPAIPTVLFGRSLAMLNLGNSLYFLLGVIIFTSGVLRYLKFSKTADAICAILLASFLHIYYFNYLLLHFEQSVYPFCFALILVGLYLHYTISKSFVALIPSAFVLLYLVYSYTPALALYFLVLCVLLFLLAHRNVAVKEKTFFAGLIVFSLLSFIITMKYRTDINLISSPTTVNMSILSNLSSGYEHILFQNHGTPFVSTMYAGVFIGILLFSCFLFFGRAMAFLALWIIATITLSLISKGYTDYSIDFRLQRATVVFPVFFLLLMFVLDKIHAQHKVRYLYTCSIFLFFTGFLFHINYVTSATDNPQYSFIQFLQNHNLYEEPMSKTITFVDDAGSYNNLISLNDTLQYFLPGFTTATAISQTPCNLSANGIVVISSNDKCYAMYAALTKHNYGMFTTNENSQLAVLEE